jgi:sucrose-6-phosphate hydrolase SacC (GH32 family)
MNGNTGHSLAKRLLISTLSGLGLILAAQAELPTPVKLDITGKYLLLPVRCPGKDIKANVVRVEIDGVVAYQFGVFLAPTAETVDAWGCLDISEYAGRKAVISMASGPAENFQAASAMITCSDTIKSTVPIYAEKGRPQFHFSQRVGWNNDPNGMVYSDGLYHLSWQCNPMIAAFANMFWGHAVSRDLVHWEEMPLILRTMGKGKGGKVSPDTHPAMVMGQAFSGGAAVDRNNTLGKQTGNTKTLILCVTDTGGGLGGDKGKVGEALAYSTDNGKTYKLLRDYNPIISHEGRDPKLFWHEPSKCWCVVVYNGGHSAPPPVGWIGKMEFYSSKDLKTWTKESETDEIFHECPEFVELPVDGNQKNKKWLLFDATPKYQIGSFDGKLFKPDYTGTRQCIGGEVKAAQCFSDAPDGRAIAMLWARTAQKDKHTPFNQGFTLPLELTLETATDGVRCYANPVPELKALRGNEILSVKQKKVAEGESGLQFNTPAELAEIDMTLDYSSGKKPASIEIILADMKFTYDLATKELAGPRGKLTSYDKEDGKLDLHLFVDRPTVEVFAEHGAVYMLSNRANHGAPLDQLKLRITGGDATIESLKAYQLKSIWPKR